MVQILLNWKNPSRKKKFVDPTVSDNYCYQFVSDELQKNHPNEEIRKDFLEVKNLLIAWTGPEGQKCQRRQSGIRKKKRKSEEIS